MVVGALTFARAIDTQTVQGALAHNLLVITIVLLFTALLSTWYAALALIHMLEPPYKASSRILNLLVWAPHGNKWEVVCGGIAGCCLGAGLTFFVFAVVVNAAI